MLSHKLNYVVLIGTAFANPVTIHQLAIASTSMYVRAIAMLATVNS